MRNIGENNRKTVSGGAYDDDRENRNSRRIANKSQNIGRAQDAARGGEKQRKVGKKKKWIISLAIVMGVLVVAALVLMLGMYSIYKNIAKDPLSAFDKPHVSSVTIRDDNNVVHEKTSDIVNILLLGIDSSAEREAKNKGYRSDTIILCSIDFGHGKMEMISVPRDTRVTMNKLNKNTGEVTSTTTNKINAAYAFGGGPNHYGAKNTMDCVETFLSCDGKFDIKIDYFASIDMDGLPKLANSIGGVDVVLDRNLTGIGKKGATVTITSKNIDSYLRNRHTGGGDDGRAQRQQDFIISMIKKIKKQGAASSAAKLFNDVITYVKTDMQLEQILALAAFADDFDIDTDLETYRVKGTGKTINGTWFYIPDTEGLESFILEQFYDPTGTESESNN